MPQNQTSASELLVTINESLNQLGDIVSRSQLPPEEKQQFGQVLSSFNEFASMMTEAPGQSKPKAPMGMQGNVPPETMGRNAKPAMM